jgi:hypothetical protein
MSLAHTVLGAIADHYLESGDYNGLPLAHLDELGDLDDVLDAVRELVRSRQISIRAAVASGNPFIKRHPDWPVEKQLDLLQKDEPSMICLYPGREILQARPEIASYNKKPYEQRMALGDPQLTPVFFELEVLDRYRRDARYIYGFGDYTGHFLISDAASQDESMAERHKVSLQTFGIARRPNGLRAVAVFLRYLAALSPDHQALWRGFELDEDCQLAPPYVYETEGIWREEHERDGSVFQAFLEEQELINEIGRTMGRPSFFRKTWLHDRPRTFSPFMYPTQASYSEFIHLLDKMLSDNVDPDWFGDDVPRTTANGERLGTLALLEAWLSRPAIQWRSGRGTALVAPWRAVRQLRQKPAHTVEEDRYDANLYAMQNDLMERAYLSMNALRVILSSHPNAQAVEVPDWIACGRVRHY